MRKEVCPNHFFIHRVIRYCFSVSGFYDTFYYFGLLSFLSKKIEEHKSFLMIFFERRKKESIDMGKKVPSGND